MAIDSVSAQEAKQQLDRGEVLLVDVREPWEVELAAIAGAELIPLGELSARIDALPSERPLLFVCHHGVRSYHACLLADSRGLHALNLRGGIDAWSREVDPRVPRY